MVKRILSSIIIFPLLLLLIGYGGIPLKAAVMGLIWIALYEVYKAFSKTIKPIHFVGFLFAWIYMFFIDKQYPNASYIIMILFVFTTFFATVILNEKMTIVDCMVVIFGFFYIVLFMSTIYTVRVNENGKFLVWLIFIAAWGCDTGAYFTGIAIGKHKLMPKLSPKKTIEGSIGGIVVATLLAALYGFIVSKQFAGRLNFNIVAFSAIACFFGSILAQFGDLTASAIKRYTDIKDFGKLIPGHGGIMDRFDSVLFTAPAVYVTMLLLL